MKWYELVRARWKDPFSRLRREWFELSTIRDLIVQDQLTCPAIQERTTQPLGAITRTMSTESKSERGNQQ